MPYITKLIKTFARMRFFFKTRQPEQSGDHDLNGRGALPRSNRTTKEKHSIYAYCAPHLSMILTPYWSKRSFAQRSFIFILLCWLSSICFALENDKDSPIEIEADKVDINYAEGLASYTGNVKLTQGSILVKAASILISTENNQMKQVEIRGEDQPAIFQQRINQNQQILGQAMKIILTPNKDDISFIGNAMIEEESNQISAPYIVYNSRSHKIVANNQGDDTERIRMTFTPEQTDPEDNSTIDSKAGEEN